MQRSNAAVRVKDVIGALCSLLTATGLSSVPTPEAFRRAKFNRGPDVEDQFWKLLASILKTTKVVSSDAFQQLKEASDHRTLVATGLWQTGYQAEWIYGRGEESRSEESVVYSRDLLLALGWLLGTGILEELLAHRAKQLDITILKSTLVCPQVIHGTQFDPASLRRLQWLIGCLRFQRRSLLAMQEERARLLHAVLSASSLPSVSSSNHSSSALRQDCEHMQHLCDLLKAYVNWKNVEKLFWTWMDSVVDCHLTARKEVQPAAVASLRHVPNKNRPVCLHGNRGLEKLDNMLLKLPTSESGKAKEEERKGRAENDGEVRKERGEELHCTFETLSPLPSFLLPSLPLLPQAYRVKLEGERSSRSVSHPAVRHCDGARPTGELKASQVSQLLLQTVARLQEGRSRSKLANSTELQEMIGTLDKLVLIPPLTNQN
ncbi:tubulin epsilon and delta complex protein 1 [Lampris incognitus]|uniref:tubulin epsilon and delta complex protein 1 n=1 Tax=Lampris incognitus TaxID=2546036 RepID=UPI0024B5F702|nr:tubulin epsilon and delta complex protein 1 [Lampris incognitus]